MTANELLDEVKLRFYSLLHNDADKLEALLRQALGAYQDRAGVIEYITINALEKNVAGVQYFSVPSDFLARVMVKSKTGNFVQSIYVRSEKYMTVGKGALVPLSLSYFVNLRAVDLDEYDIQPDIIGLIQEYLEILISIPNSERNRRIALAGNLDISDIPSEESLYTRKKDIEERMKSAKSALPMVSIQS
jgi:hypothetical protein